MTGTAAVLVEVSPRDRESDPASKEAFEEAAAAGVAGLKGAQVSRLYRLEGVPAAQTAERIARELLADPVTETYAVSTAGLAPAHDPRNPAEVVVDVWYKRAVTDPAAESVEKGVRDLGIRGVTARCGHRARFFGTTDVKRLDAAAARFLANPAVQEWTVAAGGAR